MLKQARKHKWWLVIITLGLALALPLQSPITKMNNPATVPYGCENNIAAYTNSNQTPEHEFCRDAMAAADEKNEHILQGKQVQLTNKLPPRWQQQGFTPDIFEAQPEVPPVAAAARPPGAQGKAVTESSPQSTAAEAQLTLQTYLKKLSWQEKAMVLKTLTKFSPGEMLEVFRLYKQGSREAYRNLDAIVMAKISEADFEKLRALVNKYR